jgi:hypothetical protein
MWPLCQKVPILGRRKGCGFVGVGEEGEQVSNLSLIVANFSCCTFGKFVADML